MILCLLRFITIALAGLCAAGVLAAQDSTDAKKTSSRHTSKARRTSTAKSTAAAHAKTASHAKTSSAKTVSHRKKSSKKPVASRRSSQQQPTAERYKEIQQALADRGFFNGPVDGNWGPDSIDALKRFQREQNLPDDGKLGSLSLIAMGLGPKRTELAEKPAQP